MRKSPDGGGVCMSRASNESTAVPSPRRLSRFYLCALLQTLSACTDASLYSREGDPSQPDRLALSGRVCTDNPADRSFPLRVLFLVDASPVLGCVDTAGVRIPALQEAVGRVLSPARPGRQVAVARYAGEAELLTDGFTADATAATDAVASTLQGTCTQGCRDTENAMQLAMATLSGDLLRTPAGTRSRTRYTVVLLAAGPPVTVPCECREACGCATCAVGCGDPACLRQCIGDRLLQRVDEMDAFVRDNGAADFTLHAVHLRMPDGCDPSAAFLRGWADELLPDMAERGGGQYAAFDDAVGFSYQSISLESLESPFQMASLMASNVHVRVGADGPASDSDADGLSDAEEQTIGSRADRRDTDADGLSDRVEVLLAPTGVRVTEADQPTVCLGLDPLSDDDGDGLRDCEEAVLGTNPTLVDTDLDGLPDWIEFLWGTNYMAPDVLGDLDQDGSTNGAELLLHSDPRANDPQARAELGYQYSVISGGVAPHPFFGELVELTGVTPVAATPNSNGGVGRLSWDGAAGTLSWQDPGDFSLGPPVAIGGEPRVVLQAQSSTPGGADERSLSVDVVEDALPDASVEEELSIGFVEQECVDFRVSNVLLRGTEPTDESVAGTNRVYLFFGEVPRDNPLGVPLYRAALVQTLFLPPDLRDPPADEIVLTDDEFVLLGGDP